MSGSPDITKARRSGDWYVWDHCALSNGHIVWKEGQAYARCRACGESWLMGPAAAPSPDVCENLAFRDAWEARLTVPDVAQYLYLKRRGVREEEIIELFSSHPMLPDRVVIPVSGLDGTMDTWQARSIREGGFSPKYLTPPGWVGWKPTHQCVWGLNRIKPGGSVTVCEGVFTALYFPDGVAVLNARMHEPQFLTLMQLEPGSIHVAIDKGGEPLAESVNSHIKHMHRWGGVTSVVAPSDGAKDFGELLSTRT